MTGIRKAVWTLNLGNNYAPDICALTYPLLKHYARKIQADFNVISERRFHGWPSVYEKLQIHELGRDYDLNIYIDSDAIVLPEMPDLSVILPQGTVMHYNRDIAVNRWRYDKYFRRDGRHIGSCDWFTAAWSDCLDLWRPLDDLTLEEAVANIFPALCELRTGLIEPSHLIDDYTLSRNIAKFGLRFATMSELQVVHQDSLKSTYVWHNYNEPEAVKLVKMKHMLFSPTPVGVGMTQELLDSLEFEAYRAEKVLQA